MPRTVEEVLRQVEDKAGMLRFLVDCAGESTATADPIVFSGLGDAFEEIQELTHAVRTALDVEALCTDVAEESEPSNRSAESSERRASRRRVRHRRSRRTR